MNKPKLRHLPLAAAALVACSGAMAGYTSPDGNFSLSGFGTLGVSKTSTNEAYFYYPGQRGGATKHASFDPDTKLAVQGTYKFTPSLSGTAQVMTKFDGDGQYQPALEWAFGKWQATPGLTLRAGRMGAPYFMISDFRNVGYANTSVRPSLEVYGQVPVSQFDGADISYQTNLGDATITSSLWSGDSSTQYTSALTKAPSLLEIKKTVGVTAQAEFSNGITVRFGHTEGKLNVKNESGSQILSYGGSAGYALVNPDAAKATFDGLGVMYDQDNWVFNAEFTKRKTKSFITNTTGWYALLGYRVNQWTPYFGVGKVSYKNDENLVNPYTPAYSGVAGGLYTLTQASLNTQKLAQTTISTGARWDVMPNVALKAQWDHIKKPKDSTGFFLIGDPSIAVSPITSSTSFLKTEHKVDVLTLSVDFIF